MAIQATKPKNRIVYFLYSEEQIKEKNEILRGRGKEFVPGTVFIGSSRKKFTQLSEEDTMPRYIDVKVVAKGELSKMRFTQPTMRDLGGITQHDNT